MGVLSSNITLPNGDQLALEKAVSTSGNGGVCMVNVIREEEAVVGTHD